MTTVNSRLILILRTSLQRLQSNARVNTQHLSVLAAVAKDTNFLSGALKDTLP